jgi:hypothetical protein
MRMSRNLMHPGMHLADQFEGLDISASAQT